MARLAEEQDVEMRRYEISEPTSRITEAKVEPSRFQEDLRTRADTSNVRQKEFRATS